MKTKLLCGALAATVVAACGAQQETEADGASVQLYTMECGRLETADAGPFADDGRYDGVARDLINPCYLVRHPEGDLIWDAGLPDALADVTEENPTPGFRMYMPRKLVDQLAEIEMAPGDVEFISVSHSHFDHLGNAALFDKATWIVDTDERAYMFRDEARQSEEFAMYAPLENFETRLIEGDGDHDVFGDGRVVIVQTPGHTPGHTILRLELENAGTVLLTGDMWHLAESREGRAVPSFNTDREQTLASMDKIEALAAETNARVVRQHVPDDYETLPAFPEALD